MNQGATCLFRDGLEAKLWLVCDGRVCCVLDMFGHWHGNQQLMYIYRLTKVNYFVHSARNSLGVAALYPARHTDMLWTKSVQFPQRTKNEFPHGYGGYGFLTHGSSFVPLFTVGRYRIIQKPCGWSESSGDSVVDKDVIGSIEVCVKNFREHLCKAVVVAAAASGGGGVAGVVVKLSCRCHLLPHHTFLPWRWFADFWDRLFNHEPPTRHRWSMFRRPHCREIRPSGSWMGATVWLRPEPEHRIKWRPGMTGTLSAVSSQGSATSKGMQVFKCNVLFVGTPDRVQYILVRSRFLDVHESRAVGGKWASVKWWICSNKLFFSFDCSCSHETSVQTTFQNEPAQDSDMMWVFHLCSTCR